MRVSDPGESAMQLPWLPPGVGSLVALARCHSPAVWTKIRNDPGAVLLLARHFPRQSAASFPGELFQSPLVLESALRQLPGGAAGAIDWQCPELLPLRDAALAYAQIAEKIALRAGGIDPACAWMGGLLAPLSWFAVGAVEPEAVTDCLRRLDAGHHSPDVQHELWGLDAEALARRLARRWELPEWLRAIAGYLSLSAQDAIQVGAEQRVFQTVQLAVLLAQTNGRHLGLPVGSDCPTLLADLGLGDEDLNSIGVEWCAANSLKSEQPPPPREPRSLLPDLLELAVERRRLEDGPFAERLEREIDRLQHALVERRQSESDRLHKQKLRALVELSAGAGHEINNPLAVISGQCQYLLRREEDPARRDLLRIVIRQTERIHQILTDLMQFARPATPRRQPNDLKPLIAEAVARQSPLAEARAVRLEWNEPAQAVFANVDPGMIRTAVAALLRNACDAAAQDGWVRLSIEAADGQWQIAIEDSGPGPTPAQIEHLFDPFFSGRSAGRGRGLGLSTAWRLVHENGGDVRFEPTEDCPSRFVIRIPQSEPAAEPGPSTSDFFPARKIA